MSTTLYLIRHGETHGNRTGRFQTYDTPLSDNGRRQAERLAARLVAESPFSALYTSDLHRTRETAQILAARLALAPVETPALRELDCGDWKGRMRTEMEAETPGRLAAWVRGGGRERFEGEAGECVEDVRARALPFLDQVLARHPGERVALVSHGWTIAIMLAHIHTWDHHEAFAEQRIQLGNTAVSIVEVAADGAMHCPLLGCVAHLDGELLAAQRAI